MNPPSNIAVLGSLLIGCLVGGGAIFFGPDFGLSEPPGGVFRSLHSVYALLAAAFIALGFTSVGALLQRHLIRAADLVSPTTYWAICFALGATACAVALQVLGLTGQISYGLIRWSSIGVFLISMPLAAPLLRQKGCNGIQFLPGSKFILILTLSIAVFYLGIALLPLSDWDDATYQVTAARHLLNKGSLSPSPGAPPFNFPSNLQLLYLIPLSLNVDASIRVVNVVWILVAVICTYHFTRQAIEDAGTLRLTDPHGIGLLSVGLLLSSPIVWELGVTGRSEVPMTACFACAMMSLGYYHKLRRPDFLALFFLFGGMLSGIKLTGLILFSPFALFTALAVLKERGAVRLLVRYLSLFLLPCAFWYVRNFAYFGAPFFPVSISTQGIHRSPPLFSDDGEFRKVFDVTDDCELVDTEPALYSPHLQDAAAIVRTTRRSAKDASLFDLKNFLINQEKFERKPLHTFNPLLIIAPFFLGPWFRVPALRRAALLALPFGFIIAWFFTIVRYLLPAIPIGCAITAVVLSRCQQLTKRRSRALGTAVLYVSIGWCIVFLMAAITQRAQLQTAKTYFLGRQSIMEWVEENGYNYVRDRIVPVTKYLNAHVTSPSSVLMIGEARAHLLSVPYVGDYEQLGRYAVSWLRVLAKAECSLAQAKSILHREGHTYIVVNWGYFKWVLARVQPDNLERLKRALLSLLVFLESEATAVVLEQNLWIYKLDTKVGRDDGEDDLIGSRTEYHLKLGGE